MGSFGLVRQPVWEMENSDFKPALPYLKIGLVLFMPVVEGLGK